MKIELEGVHLMDRLEGKDLDNYAVEWNYDEDTYKFSISGERNELERFVIEQAKRLASELWEVGGDDDYYDYFPNAMSLVLRLGEQLGMDEKREYYELQKAVGFVFKFFLLDADDSIDMVPALDHTRYSKNWRNY